MFWILLLPRLHPWNTYNRCIQEWKPDLKPATHKIVSPKQWSIPSYVLDQYKLINGSLIIDSLWSSYQSQHRLKLGEGSLLNDPTQCAKIISISWSWIYFTANIGKNFCTCSMLLSFLFFSVSEIEISVCEVEKQ